MRNLVRLAMLLGCTTVLLSAEIARADALHDWNTVTAQILFDARAPGASAFRATAIAQTAVYEAVNAITGRYATVEPALKSDSASLEAAIAATHHAVLMALLPAQQPAIDAAYQATLDAIANGAAKTAGISVGEAAAARVLELRADDGADTVDTYRPYTSPGVYVPTPLPLGSQSSHRKPWLLSSPDQYRPGPPPALSSEQWARDFAEIKSYGSKNSVTRSSAQTDTGRFWEATGPIVYFPVVRSVTDVAGREVTENARVLALAAQALDDAYVAVFDAKYTYNFWRPITAIRNGDRDDNDATEREAAWLPLIETPMHPEYPCAHCALSACLGAVIEAEFGATPSAPLRTTSTTLPGSARTWSNVADFVAEVANARVWAGVHFRNSTEIGTALGHRVGEEVSHHEPKTSY